MKKETFKGNVSGISDEKGKFFHIFLPRRNVKWNLKPRSSSLSPTSIAISHSKKEEIH
jgi:hypothetical protein